MSKRKRTVKAEIKVEHEEESEPSDEEDEKIEEEIRCEQAKFNKPLKIINQNIQGLLEHKIYAYYQIINEEEPDVVVLTQT